MRRVLCGVLWAAVLWHVARADHVDAVGGGYTHCGMLGEYFANADLSGPPAFARRDVRIDFDWGSLAQVGGSNTPSLRTFPRDNFSVRWTGEVIVRFTESYVFVADADEGVRVSIRPAGSGTWSVIIDQWGGSGIFQSPGQALTAGETYELQVEYRELTGAARCRLLWWSHNTPQEVIDPVAQQGLNTSSWAGFVWADKMKSSRWGSDPGTAADSLSFPSTDMTSANTIVISESDQRERYFAGTCLLSFKGQARVNTGCCNSVSFRVGTQTYASPLARGVGYDAGTNTTTALMSVDGSRLVALWFDQTSRSGGAADNTGITDIHLMLPLVPDDTVTHPLGSVVYRPFAEVVRDHYTCLRWLGGANGNTDSVWADRTLPGYAYFMKSDPSVYWSEQENWEYLVMLANETGKDLYLCLPVKACDDYFVKIADLVRYGSDGVSPYTSEQTDPVYPPLNPNLRIYVEHANEIWNWAFVSTQLALNMSGTVQTEDPATWAIMDYDGQSTANTTSRMRRWCVVRTVNMSNAFRDAFGDAAMGPRVRPLLEYQYNSEQATAYFSLAFLAAYYNNEDGNHVAQPHPVNHYVWGGGGATYYGVGNPVGHQSRVLLADSSFEQPVLSANTSQQRPGGTSWTFTGTSGIYHSTSQNATIGSLPAADTAPDGNQAAYIIDTGSIYTTVNFPDTGWFALNFHAAYDDPGWDPTFRIFFDTVSISPRGQSDIRVAYPGDNAGLGGWSRDIGNLTSEWGSAMFHVTTTGNHTIRFTGNKTGGRETYLDNVRIASADSIMASGFGSGQAWGQVAAANYEVQLNSQSIYCRAFGLPLIAYEAGWSLGGDFTQRPIQNWCKLVHPLAERINDTAQGYWDRSGSFMNVWGVYTYWKDFDFAGAGTCPIMQSFAGISGRLRDEVTNGIPVPGKLLPHSLPCALRGDAGQVHLDSARTVNTRLDEVGAWVSWLFTTPERALYAFRVYARGTGSLTLDVNGDTVGSVADAAGGGATPLSVELTRGGHAVRVLNTSGDFTIDSIVVSSTPVSVGHAGPVMPGTAQPRVAPQAAGWGVAKPVAPPASASAALEQKLTTRTDPPVETGPTLAVLADAPGQGVQQQHRPDAVRGDNLEPAAIPVAPAFTVHNMRWDAPEGCLAVVSVRASSELRTHAAANTTDRRLTTRWAAKGDGAAWVEYDLGSVQTVGGTSLVWYGRSAGACMATVQGSTDGIEFRDVHVGCLQGRGTQSTAWRFGRAVPVRYIRVCLEPEADLRVPSLYELGLTPATCGARAETPAR